MRIGSVSSDLCGSIFVLIALLGTHVARSALLAGPVVADGGGAAASTGTNRLLAACAQPGGVGLASAPGGVQHAAGFLQVFQLNTGRDLDGDGVADAVDPDNENDGLSDAAEVAGSSFSPVTATGINTADTDSDGLSDGQEAIAGTNPTDPASNLRVSVVPAGYLQGSTYLDETNGIQTNVTLVVTGLQVQWSGRAGKTYQIDRTADVRSTPYGAQQSLTSIGPGAGPWQVVTNVWVDTNLISRSFYRVLVQP